MSGNYDTENGVTRYITLTNGADFVADDRDVVDENPDALYFSDLYRGWPERLILFAGGGDDQLFLDEPTNSNTCDMEIHGNAGNDTIVLGTVDDFLLLEVFGGVGNDTIHVTNGDARAYGGDGDDTLIATHHGTYGGTVLLTGGTGRDVFDTRHEDPFLVPNGYLASTDIVIKDFTIGEDSWYFDGEVMTQERLAKLIWPEESYLEYAEAINGVHEISPSEVSIGTPVVDGDTITFNFQTHGEWNVNHLYSVEFIVAGGNASEFLQNLPSGLIFDGTDAGDVLDDTFVNEFGNTLGNGNETVTAGGGNDRVYLYGGNDTARGEAGNDRIYGGAGDDLLYGGNHNDELFGGAGDDLLNGGNGTDKMYGGAGQDQIIGGGGRDILSGGDDSDALHGGADADRLYGGDSQDLLHGNNGNDSIFGGFGDDRLNGGAGDDRLVGGGGHDQIQGNMGADVISGYAGDDVLAGYFGKDQLFGGGGNDQMRGGSGDDLLSGHRGNDRMYGGNGHDELNGHSGQDILNGGNGNDTMTGGAGSDTFIFASGDGTDTITDFTDGVDRIKVEATGIEALTFVQNGEDVVIKYGDDDRVTLLDFSASDLSNSDFAFI